MTRFSAILLGILAVFAASMASSRPGAARPRFVVARFEGDIAILVVGADRVHCPRAYLPEGTEPGDVVSHLEISQ